MKWVTRERPKIDRLACPWLIRRFIDPQAEIHYVPAAQVLPVAGSEGAIPFDVPEVELTHSGPLCSFDAFLEKYHRSEEHTSELQSPCNLVCRLLLEKKKKRKSTTLHQDINILHTWLCSSCIRLYFCI